MLIRFLYSTKGLYILTNVISSHYLLRNDTTGLNSVKASKFAPFFARVRHHCGEQILGGERLPAYQSHGQCLQNRLRLILAYIIFASQNAFVKGRQILDSVLIEKEYPNSQLKSSVPGVLCKLDVEKACDQVYRKFLLYLLGRCGFSDK